MEIGISTACFYPNYTEDTISIISGLGADLCEVFFEADCEYDKDFSALINDRLIEYKVRANSMHAFCATFEHQLFSDYERRRKDALIIFRKALQSAATIGAKSYTFHGDKRVDSLKGVDYKHYGRCFDVLTDMAEEHGIILGWENVAWCQSSRPEFIRNIKDVVRNNYLKFTLDIKQARRANVNIDEYIDAMGKDIVNVHVNDYNDTSTCMLPGNGYVDFLSFFEKLKKVRYKGNAIIEVYSSNYQDVMELGKSLDYLKSMQ